MFESAQPASSLPDHQLMLLSKLVTLQEERGGAEFHLAESFDGANITYVSGPSFPVARTDLMELVAQHFVRLESVGPNTQCGWVTQNAILLVRNQMKARSILPALPEGMDHKLQVTWESILKAQRIWVDDIPRYDANRKLLFDMVSQLQYTSPLFQSRMEQARALGLDPTRSATDAWFRSIEEEYWHIWIASGKRYEVYALWLDEIKIAIMTAVTRIWKARSRVTDDWFETTCRPVLEAALDALIQQRIAAAKGYRASTQMRGSTVPKTDVPFDVHVPPFQKEKDQSCSIIQPPPSAYPNRSLVEAYIREVFEQTGKRITKTDIWKSAGYKTRTQFERWERGAPNASKSAHRNFTRLLQEKPHLK